MLGHISRLVNGSSRPTVTAGAALALLVSASAGALLAARADDVRQSLSHSIIWPDAENGKAVNAPAEVLLDPQKTELLMRYIDAMGTAAAGFEVPAREYLPQCMALADAAQQAGCSLEGFVYQESERAVDAVCAGGDEKAPQVFLEAVEQSGIFARAEQLEMQADDGQKFTIRCWFS